MKTISFDLGGSGGKLYLGDYSGGRLSLREVHRFKNRGIPMGSGLYWDFLSIYENLILGLKKAAQAAEGEIATLGLDSFSNDFGLVSPSGSLLSQVHCYRDERSRRFQSQIDQILSPKLRHQLSGNQVALSNTLMHLAAMILDGQGGMLDCASKLLLVPDLLVYFLTGKAVSEYTISSVSELFDFDKQDWNQTILDAYGIRRSLLAPVSLPGSVVGRLNPKLGEELGLSSLQVVSVCEHDTASAFLSAPCRGPAAIISSGTWSLVGTETSSPIRNDITYRCNIANEGGYPGHHRMVKAVMGLWLMQEVQAYWADHGESYSFAELDRLAEEARPFTWFIDPDDTLFFGQGDMPGRIRRRCLEVFGSAPETVGEICRCILESLALKYRWSIERLEEITNQNLAVVHIVGGGSKDSLLCQFTADACNKKVEAGPADATALGNTMVQLLSQRQLASIEEGRQRVRESFPIQEFLPGDTAVWDRQYQKFLNTYELERR